MLNTLRTVFGGGMTLLALMLLSSQAFARTATLSWDANPESNLAGYKVYYGTQSRDCNIDPQNETYYYNGTQARESNAPIVLFLEDIADPSAPSYRMSDLSDTQAYYFTVTAFLDNGAESLYSNEAAIMDSAAPALCTAGASSPTQVVLDFNEFIDTTSATTAGNFSLTDSAAQAVTINSISYDFVSFKNVTLNTATLSEGETYTLSVSNVQDFFGGNAPATPLTFVFTYTAAPHIRRVTPLQGRNTLEIEFSENVTRATAGLTSNYMLDNGISVNTANLAMDRNSSDNERTVHLGISPLTEGTTYQLTVDNVADAAANAIAAASIFGFTHAVDNTAPRILSAHLVNAANDRSKVYVTFSEHMRSDTAGVAANYSVNGGIDITGARLFADRRTAILTTDRHLGGNFTLSTVNLTDDSAAGNTIPAADAQLAYWVPDIADLNADNVIDSLDMAIVMSNWGQIVTVPGQGADLDLSGDVGQADFSSFLSRLP